MNSGLQPQPERIFVGVTGGQGVGKTSFCGKLVSALAEYPVRVTLLDGLGYQLKALGIPFGSAATSDGIAAAYEVHISRQRTAPPGIVLLDRCLVDALAYVRTLRVTSAEQTAAYEEIGLGNEWPLAVIINLEMTGIFTSSQANHETPELRAAVADEIAKITASHPRSLNLYAAAGDAVDRAVIAITDVAKSVSLSLANHSPHQ